MKTVELNGNPLSLTNDGNLEIFFIGVGSAQATKRYQTNFLIIKGKTHLLVDFGQTGQIALQKTAGLGLSDIRAILPTHSHGDHVGGIESLALDNRYVGKPFKKLPKTKMIINEEYQRVLWDYTLRGGLEYNEEDSQLRNLALTDYFEIIRPKWKTMQPREIHKIKFGGIVLEIFRTKHIPDSSSDWQASFISYGLMIDDRVFLSCDTRFDPELLSLYQNAEYFFHDVQFFPGAVHAPLADLKALPENIKKRMLLMHYADNFDKQDVSDFAGFAQQGVRYIF
jgi:ribonuclease BN (tRNA processing enzyme)